LIVHRQDGDGRSAAQVARLADALSAIGRYVQLASLPQTRSAATELAGAKLELSFLRDQLGPPRRRAGAAAPPPPAPPPARPKATSAPKSARG